MKALCRGERRPNNHVMPRRGIIRTHVLMPSLQQDKCFSSFQLTLAVIVISKCKIMQIVPSDARTYSKHTLIPTLVRGGGGGELFGTLNPYFTLFWKVLTWHIDSLSGLLQDDFKIIGYICKCRCKCCCDPFNMLPVFRFLTFPL